ncbi:hypothetical protein AAFF_G00299390 [Aldrovandia affinis]|uniref:Dolichyl-diphosphooligosaccharide--protein glycosyltransferase subunit DAD1 n=1 Tax=Aldrovandia affinis TaxID=143900 RepID=A0AAD7R8G2_9TELE|nr:hypothetical protein AAFF_G00299390 [Aldrovandia affinis]
MAESETAAPGLNTLDPECWFQRPTLATVTGVRFPVAPEPALARSATGDSNWLSAPGRGDGSRHCSLRTGVELHFYTALSSSTTQAGVSLRLNTETTLAELTEQHRIRQKEELSGLESVHMAESETAAPGLNTLDPETSTPNKLKVVDAYLLYILLTGALQFLYCLLVGTFPFNSFLSGFISCVGAFILGVCLRIQINPLNKGDFLSVSPERAFADFLFAHTVLHLVPVDRNPVLQGHSYTQRTSRRLPSPLPGADSQSPPPGGTPGQSRHLARRGIEPRSPWPASDVLSISPQLSDLLLQSLQVSFSPTYCSLLLISQSAFSQWMGLSPTGLESGPTLGSSMADWRRALTELMSLSRLAERPIKEESEEFEIQSDEEEAAVHATWDKEQDNDLMIKEEFKMDDISLVIVSDATEAERLETGPQVMPFLETQYQQMEGQVKDELEEYEITRCNVISDMPALRGEEEESEESRGQTMMKEETWEEAVTWETSSLSDATEQETGSGEDSFLLGTKTTYEDYGLSISEYDCGDRYTHQGLERAAGSPKDTSEFPGALGGYTGDFQYRGSVEVSSQIFPCTQCPVSFTVELYLHRHLKRSHPEEYVTLMRSKSLIVESLSSPSNMHQSHTSPDVVLGSATAVLPAKDTPLSQNRAVANPARAHACSHCGKSFTRKNDLKKRRSISAPGVGRVSTTWGTSNGTSEVALATRSCLLIFPWSIAAWGNPQPAPCLSHLPVSGFM